MSANAQRERKPWTPIRIIRRVVMIGLLLFGIWALAPYFFDQRVDEAFPVAAPAADSVSERAAAPVAAPSVAPSAAVAAADSVSERAAAPVAAPPVAPSAAVAAADSVSERAAAPVALPTVAAPAANTISERVAPTAAPTADTLATQAAAAPAPTAVPAEPVALSVGSFTQIDALHGAEGTATIYRLPDGQLLLRLENFAAQNGPDLYVGLSGHPMPRSNAEVNQNYLELARLKANQGNQNYELPADLDINSFQSVVIYCKAFSVVFSTAGLTN